MLTKPFVDEFDPVWLMRLLRQLPLQLVWVHLQLAEVRFNGGIVTANIRKTV